MVGEWRGPGDGDGDTELLYGYGEVSKREQRRGGRGGCGKT